jgi:microcystin-dependent protein
MANFLKSLFVKGIEIDPDGATSAQVLSYNGTKFVPVTNSATATTDASLLTSGTLDNARLPAAATNITSVGTLGSLAVTNGVTAATFTGALTGNASTVTTNANLTGDVTSVGNATTIGANKVTRSMLAATEQMPVGTILMWAGGSTTTATYTTSDVPDGFLLCDGTAVSRTTYSTLFTNLDIRYGQGDGSSTFNLPNLIAFAPVGAKTASAKTNGIRGTANAVATSFTTTEATSATAHHSHTLTGSNSTASNIALTGSNSTASNIGITGSNSTASNIAITGGNSNIAAGYHRHAYQKPTSNYFQTDTNYANAEVLGSNSSIGLSGNNAAASNIGLSGSNAAASSIGLSGSNAAASNLSAATLTSGNTTAHSHTISGHAVVYIIKY